MSKKIRLQNSTVLLIGILLIIFGISIGFLDYLKEKKDKAFSDMSLLLYESEIPQNIYSENEIEEKQEEIDNSNDDKRNTQNESSNEEVNQIKYDYIGILEIPKINLKRGFVGLDSRYNNVNYNITVIKGSTFPDEEKNNLILAAHSGICSVCFFDKLYNLSIGDSAYITYKNIKYSYKIVNIYEVEKDGTVAIYRDYSKNTLTLITCTRNSNTKQTVYILELYSKENN